VLTRFFPYNATDTSTRIAINLSLRHLRRILMGPLADGCLSQEIRMLGSTELLVARLLRFRNLLVEILGPTGSYAYLLRLELYFEIGFVL
jgi:hypothetical protein